MFYNKICLKKFILSNKKISGASIVEAMKPYWFVEQEIACTLKARGRRVNIRHSCDES